MWVYVVLILKHFRVSDTGSSFVDRDMFCRFAGIGVGHEVQFPAQRFQTQTSGSESSAQSDEEMDKIEDEDDSNITWIDFDSLKSSESSHDPGPGLGCADDNDNREVPLAEVENDDNNDNRYSDEELGELVGEGEEAECEKLNVISTRICQTFTSSSCM